MKIFVINLEKNHDRMSLISSRLSVIGLSCIRVDAVWGKMAASSEKKANTSSFWWWCIKGYPMRDGEYGCAMSHLSVYRRMVEEKIDIACVLEDDANPRACLLEVLDFLQSRMDIGKPQVALISNHRGEPAGNELSLHPVLDGAFADGYVITLPAAIKLLNNNLPVKCPSDTWSFWRRKGWLELYQVYPEGVNQEWEQIGYQSDVTAVGDHIVDVCKMTFMGKFLWKTKRLVGMCIALLFLRGR